MHHVIRASFTDWAWGVMIKFNGVINIDTGSVVTLYYVRNYFLVNQYFFRFFLFCFLQEVETDQFYKFFLPELKRDGYDGIFSPKSRAKTMAESERKYVDGCAIFYRTAK